MTLQELLAAIEELPSDTEVVAAWLPRHSADMEYLALVGWEVTEDGKLALHIDA